MKGEKTRLEEEIKESRNDLNKFIQDKQNLSELQYKENIENERVVKLRENCRMKLQGLKNGNRDIQKEQLNGKYARINSRIQQNKFKDQVVGPLCHYISLKEQKWFKPISVCLNNSLNNYIVFEKSDKEVLMRIFQEQGVKFPILLLTNKSEFKNLRIPENLKTMLSVLEFKYGFIMNVLITYHNIERTILLEDRTEAYRIIEEQRTNVLAAYTLNADKIQMKGGKLADNCERKLDLYYFEDSNSKIRNLEREIRQLDPKTEIKRQLQDLSNRINNIERILGGKMKEINNIEEELKSYELV